MSFEKLLENIEAGKVEEAKQVASELQESFSNTTKELTTWETRFNEVVPKRDQYKSKLKEVSEALGISEGELSKDAISAMLKSGKTDESLKAEIDSLNATIESLNNDYAGKLSESENRFKDKVIETEIAKIGLSANVVNDRALSLVIDALKDGASIEEGVVVYRDANGATIRNQATGSPLTIADKMSAFQSDANNSFLFKATANGGGGASASQGGGEKTIERSAFEKKSPVEQMNFVQSGGTVI